MEIVVTDWIPYKYGQWQRLGNTMKVFADKRIMPVGFIPEESAVFNNQLAQAYLFNYYWIVRIKGWTNNIQTQK